MDFWIDWTTPHARGIPTNNQAITSWNVFMVQEFYGTRWARRLRARERATRALATNPIPSNAAIR